MSIEDPSNTPVPELLWPVGTTGVDPTDEIEQVEYRDVDQDAFGLNRSISKVTRPLIWPYLPQTPSQVAVLVLPGGGFTRIVIDKEGHAVARWLRSAGIAAFVLKYRTVDRGHPASLEDVRRAIRTIRSRSGGSRIDPQRIGVIGFSAGGYLAIRTATEPDEGEPGAVDALERTSCRPDFFAAVYPAVPDEVDRYVTGETPPGFFVHTLDDGVPAAGSIKMHDLLQSHNVASELNLFAEGGHAYGLGIRGGEVAVWPDRFIDWLGRIGVLRQGSNPRI